MLKKALRPALGVLVTVLLVLYGVHYLNNLLRPVDTDSPVNAVETFHQMPENSLEVIGYGSSHMWRGMDAMEMYESYGIGAYNYGCNWQELNTTLLFLKDSLRTQSPKVVVMDTFHVNTWKMDMDMDGEIYYTRAIPWFSGKIPYLRQCFGSNVQRYLSYFVPLAAFHENWVNLSGQSFRTPEQSGDNFFRSMGSEVSMGVTPVSLPDQSQYAQEELYDGAVELLDEIVDICRQRRIELVFVTIPWEGGWLYADAMESYAQEKGCAYLNMFADWQQTGLEEATDFSDSGHLNQSGARKVARYLGAYLKEHYDLSDMRTVENNLWEQAAKG